MTNTVCGNIFGRYVSMPGIFTREGNELMETCTKQRTDTPPVSVYQEYDQRKRDLFLKYGHGPEYDEAVRELICELGI
jgi:hypothetical protein